MAKRFNQLTQLTAAQVAQNDIIPIRDESAGQTKYITVKDLTGSPDTGWTATGEAWTFSSWTAASFLAVVTVPTDATTKYGIGMYVRFSQATGGTKYGKILAVTATTLTIWMPGYTLNNETITSPVYSTVNVPVGLPATISEGQPYRFEAYYTGSQALSTTIKVPMNTEVEDGAGVFDSVTNYRFTAPVAGTYHFDGQAFMGSAGMGTNESALIILYKNGAEYSRSFQMMGSGNTVQIVRPNLSRNVRLAAGDYIELYATMVGSRDIIGGNNSTYLTGHMVSR